MESFLKISENHENLAGKVDLLPYSSISLARSGSTDPIESDPDPDPQHCTVTYLI